MRRFGLIIILAASALMAGCSCWGYVRDLPSRLNKNPNGWFENRVNTLHYVGSFVLNKGESKDNGNIGVKVAEIQHAPCPPHGNSTESDGSKVRLIFYKVFDQSTLCDVTLETSSGLYIAEKVCGRKQEFDYIDLGAINDEAGWVSFSLLMKE